VADIGAAAAAEHGETVARQQRRVLLGQLRRVALVELLGFVQLGMARPGRIGPKELDPSDRLRFDLQRWREMIGVGAVDAEVQGSGLRGGVEGPCKQARNRALFVPPLKGVR